MLFPLGLSFYTFQAIAYVADIYTGKFSAEKNPLTLFSFILFFPVVSSGPIQRARRLIPQLQSPSRFDYTRATDGLKLFAWGLFKKLVVADRIAFYVDHVYASAESAPRCALLLAAVLYSFQIYADFSGYSDMAIGSAQFLGFDVGVNFDHPYLSQSVGEFWRRWHMSLSSWLRDYIYIPLGGSRVCVPRIYLNLLITFLVSGIWHGSSAHFVVWGLFLGLVICVERMTKTLRAHCSGKGWQVLFVIVTFIVITVSWVFFRAETTQQAVCIIKKILTVPADFSALRTLSHEQGIVEAIRTALMIPGEEFGGIKGMFLLVLSLSIFLGASALTYKTAGLTKIHRLPLVLRWTLYVLLCLLILLFYMETETTFIYNGF